MLSASAIDALYELIGTKIKAARKGRLSQQALGSHAGLSRTSISNIEAGRHRLPIHQLLEIARVLNRDLSELLPSREELGTLGDETQMKVIGGELTPELKKLVLGIGGTNAD